jgi:hypothetical protein
VLEISSGFLFFFPWLGSFEAVLSFVLGSSGVEEARAGRIQSLRYTPFSFTQFAKQFKLCSH